MAIICLLSLLPSISVLANENYITNPATSLRGKSDSAVPTRLQQNGKTITGIVQDALGPIAGANIIVKGTTNGNITDMDGKFTLENVPANATLVISYIGFTPQEIRVGNQTTFNITLQEDSEALDEVVVVGYGVMKKKRLDRSRFTIEQQFDERPQSVASDRSYGRKNWPVYRYNKSEGNRDKRPQSVCAGPAPSRHPAPRCMLSTDIRWENKT